MSTILFQGDLEKGGIPRKAKVRIVSMPRSTPVFVGRASKGVALDLDPGKYRYSITKIIGNKRLFNYTGEFYHEVTPEAFEKLTTCKPSMMKAIHTSEGLRWRCTFPTCREDEFSSEVSALLHEVTHFGVDEKEFLKNPDMRILYDGKDRVEAYLEKQKTQKRSMGEVLPDPLGLGSPVAASPRKE